MDHHVQFAKTYPTLSVFWILFLYQSNSIVAFLIKKQLKHKNLNFTLTIFVLFFNELSLLDLSLLGVRERFLSLLFESSFLE
jgi:hypothetical protein